MGDRPLMIAIPPAHTGLGNRVRSVLGVRSLAAAESRDFAYAWTVGRWFGAQLTDLWEFDERQVPERWTKLLRVRYPYHDNTLTWLDDRVRRSRVIQVRTGHALHLPAQVRPWEDALRQLVPSGAVRAGVEGFFEEHLDGEPYVGVMIRAHAQSHELTLRHSPVSWYVDRMAEIQRGLPGVRFFVSCDVEGVQARVLELFPTAIAQSGKGAYNSRESVIAAVVDLYLLAGASHLLAPYWSSFPELAHHLAGGGSGFETSMTGAQDPDTLSLCVVDDPLVPWRRRSSPAPM